MSAISQKRRDQIECALALNPAVDPETLAQRVGVSLATVWNVWAGMTRAHHDEPLNDRSGFCEACDKWLSKLDDHQKRKHPAVAA